MKKITLVLFLLITGTIFCQNKRDRFIEDSIVSIQNSSTISAEEKFNTLLKNIEQLENDYKTYEPEFRYHMLLQKAFDLNKIDFFKNQLSILVEKYGFNVAYMNEKELYYNSIMKGELSAWFKTMYLDKHFIWLNNNFEKQIDQKKLNSLHEKDQLINVFSLSLDVRAKHDSIQKKKSRELVAEYFMNNAGELYAITKKYDAIPTGNTFAILQNPYAIVELHNLQSEDNYNRFYMLFFDYYKKAYLSNQLYYTIFSSIDFNSFVHFGNQKFGLITKEDILNSKLYVKNRKCPDIIPVEDAEFSKKTKKEFGWY